MKNIITISLLLLTYFTVLSQTDKKRSFKYKSNVIRLLERNSTTATWENKGESAQERIIVIDYDAKTLKIYKDDKVATLDLLTKWVAPSELGDSSKDIHFKALNSEGKECEVIWAWYNKQPFYIRIVYALKQNMFFIHNES